MSQLFGCRCRLDNGLCDPDSVEWTCPGGMWPACAREPQMGLCLQRQGEGHLTIFGQSPINAMLIKCESRKWGQEVLHIASHVRKILRRCGERQDGAQIRETPTRSNTKNCGKRIKYRLIDVDRVGADGLTAFQFDEAWETILPVGAFLRCWFIPIYFCNSFVRQRVNISEKVTTSSGEAPWVDKLTLSKQRSIVWSCPDAM